MSERIVLVGGGSISARHVRNLKTIGETNLLVVEPDGDRRTDIQTRYHVDVSSELEPALCDRPFAALVCTPPHLHIGVARSALRAGAHVFIEKPISNTMDGVDELLEEAWRGGRALCVGYNLRWQPGLQKLRGLIGDGTIGRPLMLLGEFGQYLPTWRTSRDYRSDYTAAASQGGGILLDASHEIDYACWLLGEVASVYCAAGHLSCLEMDAEDSAALTLRFASGALGEIHLDCIQAGYSRSCKVIGDEGTATWDFHGGVRYRRHESGAWTELPVTADPNESYVEELRHFLACAHGDATPIVDGLQARRVLQIVLAAKQSAATHREVPV